MSVMHGYDVPCYDEPEELVPVLEELERAQKLDRVRIYIIGHARINM